MTGALREDTRRRTSDHDGWRDEGANRRGPLIRYRLDRGFRLGFARRSACGARLTQRMRRTASYAAAFTRMRGHRTLGGNFAHTGGEASEDRLQLPAQTVQTEIDNQRERPEHP